jgi:hypothetical protein
MSDLLPADGRGWLLAELREIIAAAGAERFLTAPILEPTPRDFPDMSFLLAAQVKARGMGWLARRRLTRKLETNQSAYFRWAMKKLPALDELRRALGLAEASLAIA